MTDRRPSTFVASIVARFYRWTDIFLDAKRITMLDWVVSALQQSTPTLRVFVLQAPGPACDYRRLRVM